MKLLIGSLSKLAAFLIWNLPRKAQLALGSFIGWLWFDVLKIRRQIAIENVAIAFPELGLSERTEIARASLRSLGQTVIEYFLFPFLTKENVGRFIECEGLENLRSALGEGKGVILLALHLGNGDFGVAGLSLLGFPINLISKEFKSKWLNDLWFGMRRKLGTRFISPEKSSFEILRALRRNEVVVFVLDQFMGPPVGVRTRFFGRETGTAMGCAMMADRTRAPVVPCHTYRKPNGVHVLVFEGAIPFLDHGLREQNIAVMTQTYTDKIESFVRLHPSQWMWIHRRWKEFRE